MVGVVPPRSPVTRRIARLACLVAVVIICSAHVGTFDAFFAGRAGPYRVQVTVRAPGVVPGLAQITVRVNEAAAAAVRRVTTQAARWNVGTRGAPRPDDAVRVPGDSALWSAELWLMATGTHAINIGVEGSLGSGTVTVPFNSVATRRLGMSPGLRWVLMGLTLFLTVGLVTIVGAGAREAVLAPGTPTDARRRRTGRIAMVGGALVIALALTGGRAWWNDVDAAYRARLFVPALSSAEVRSEGTRVLRLSIDREDWQNRGFAPLIPDHGKLLHLFLVRASDLNAFAHLHPMRADSLVFESLLGALPGGEYRYFADIVHETGFSQTLTGLVTVPAPEGAADSLSDSDDAVLEGVAVSSGSFTTHGGAAVTWERPDLLLAGVETVLRFTIRDANGAPTALEPYLGMPGHAMIARDSGDVFVHLHGMGTYAAASLEVIEAVERGDTVAPLRPGVPRPRLTGMPTPRMVEHEEHSPGILEFPFAFPQPGHYRIWVQFRTVGAVQTAPFAVKVMAKEDR